MSKEKIVAEVMAASGMTNAEAKRAVAHVIDAVDTVTRRDRRCNIPGFGAFRMTFRKGRTGRNPATGEPVEILARDVMAFRPSRAG